jgi:hypothetical protein
LYAPKFANFGVFCFLEYLVLDFVLGTKYLERVNSVVTIYWELALSWNTHSRLELVDIQAVASPEASGLLQGETLPVFYRRSWKPQQLGGILKVELVNKISMFALLGGLFFAASSQVGCFRPESSLANKAEDIRATFTGKMHPAGPASLDHRTETSIERYGSTVRTYSNRYELDWRLVMAVMRHESRFAADAVSNRGAFGLMQIMPATQLELAGKLGVNETETPSNNIRAGAYHLHQLYLAIEASDEENHIRLTLAAYNAGLNRILDAQDVAAYLGDEPDNWESVKSALPLLSKRYQSLHRNIWPSGRPTAGYFTDWHQTIGYVESVMSYYGQYQVALK